MVIKNISNRPYKVLVVALVIMIVSSCLTGFAVAPKTMTVMVDGKVVSVDTRALTVKGALEDAGVVLGSADGYVLKNGKRLDSGTEIEVIRAMPIHVWKAGRTTEYSIGRATVREALDAIGVEYQDTKVYPGLDSRLTPGQTINLVSQGAEVTTEKKELPYEVKFQNDPRLPRGHQQVITPGKNGVQEVTSRVVNIGSRQIRRNIASTVVIPSTPQVVALGTGENMISTSRGYVRYRKVVQMEATAYTLAEGNGDGVTSIGIVPYKGIIAVDPRVIPYRTKVYIPGYGFAMAGDCGGAIQGNRIDLFMYDYGEAVSWGRRSVDMYILEE